MIPVDQMSQELLVLSLIPSWISGAMYCGVPKEKSLVSILPVENINEQLASISEHPKSQSL